MIAGSASGSSSGCRRSFAFLLAVIFSVVSYYSCVRLYLLGFVFVVLASYSLMVKYDVFSSSDSW